MFQGSKAHDIIRAYLVTGINHRHSGHLRCLVLLVKVVGLLVSLSVGERGVSPRSVTPRFDPPASGSLDRSPTRR
jgi:hypothetical protein